MPILELHGTVDDTAVYYGGTPRSAPIPSIRNVLRTWAVRNGCTNPVPAIDQLQRNGVYYTQYDCGGKTKTVVGYNVTGQGHWRISTQSNGDNGGATAAVNDSAIMMSFFRHHSKP